MWHLSAKGKISEAAKNNWAEIASYSTQYSINELIVQQARTINKETLVYINYGFDVEEIMKKTRSAKKLDAFIEDIEKKIRMIYGRNKIIVKSNLIGFLMNFKRRRPKIYEASKKMKTEKYKDI